MQHDLLADASPLPEGLVYRPAFIEADEERTLLASIATLPLAAADYRGYTAKRRIASFGSSYDFSANRLDEAPPLPAFLLPLRARIAAWLGLDDDAFGHALVTEYAPGTQLGWHRDVPNFEVVVGVSLGTACRMRFRPWPPERGNRRDILELVLEPRSCYVLRGAIRWQWQHQVPPTPGLRHSITFRTRRDGQGSLAPR